MAIAAKRNAYERLLCDLVSKGIRAGEFRAVDARMAALPILGTVNGTVVWYRPDGPRKAGEIAEAFADLLVGGLLR